jgi:Cellulase (glycosyl hydrolase family 5)
MRRIIIYRVLFAWILLSIVKIVPAQKSADVFVDKNGVMRWGTTKTEVQGFGINYTAPFAHAFRAAKALHVSLEKAIDNDVYHFARLGFDAYRVHVWDTEISDTLGNLLENEHLQLFDYMLVKMKERGMKLLITPIAWWGNGYPEPDDNTPGFAKKYGKGACLTNPDAIKAQENYLYQFLNHVNKYTGIAYKNDPDIVAFEVCNEPHHGGDSAKVTEFVKGMLASMRKTGCKKPIFYNISHSIQFENAYFAAGIEGGTFQWYPTGLGYRHELGGNFLPNADDYKIPFAGNPGFKKIAKVVYEFDAADVGRSYIYPALARSFRKAGIQWATHFAYDPTYMAYANTEYNTHYMNLVYAPQKALSLKLASEVFHRIPTYKSFGAYPADTSFDGFRVSYANDLAELITPATFIYTNSTTSVPVAANKLEQIAGSGNSSVVSYEGTGAYFLDKLEEGVWRLEVMPDAIWVTDPFGRNSLKKTVAVVNWHKWPMRIQLPDLGSDFTVTGVNDGNAATTQAVDAGFIITPGTYFVTKKGTTTKFSRTDHWKNIILKEFVAPATTLQKTYVLHEPPQELTGSKDFVVNAKVITVAEPEAVELMVYGGGFAPQPVKMERTQGYGYTATIPARMVREGILRYYITVKATGNYQAFPSGIDMNPASWDFYDQNPYKVRVVAAEYPMYLFDAITDAEWMNRPFVRGGGALTYTEPGRAELPVNIERLFTEDPENRNGEKRYDYTMRFYFGNKIAGRTADIAAKKKITVRARALNDKPCIVQVGLITNDGSVYGGVVTINKERGDYSISLADLKKVRLVTLPRPYPTFLPYFFEGGSTAGFNSSTIESLQISIGPGIPESALSEKHGVAIESVRLE